MAGDDIEILPPDPDWQAPHAPPPKVYDAGPADVPPSGSVRAARPAGDPAVIKRLIGVGARLAALGLVALAVLWLLEPLGPHPLTQMARWLQGAGIWGRVLVVLGMALVVPVLVPVTPAAALPGFLWGPVEGVLLGLTGATLGGLLNFAIARRLLLRHVEAWAERNPLVRSLVQTINARGFRIVLGLRISPLMSYGLLAYLSGLTALTPLRFAGAVALGGIPWTLVWVMAGAVAQPGSGLSLDGVANHPHAVALRWVGLVVTVALATWVGRLARRDVMRARR